MDFSSDDLDAETEFLCFEADTEGYQELNQESAQLLQRTYELPEAALLSPLEHFNTLYHSDSFLHNILSIYWLPVFLQHVSMDGVFNHLFGQLRLMACTRTGVTRCSGLVKDLFPERDVISTMILGENRLNTSLVSNDNYSLVPADPFIAGIFNAVVSGKTQHKDLSTDDRLSLLKYMLCFHFKDAVKGIMSNTTLSEHQRDYAVRNILFPVLKCMLRSTPCYDTVLTIIRILYTVPELADTAADRKLWALLLFREVILFQFCRCLTIFCNLQFKHNDEGNVYCKMHSLFGGVVSKNVHTENCPPVLRCRCRYECPCHGKTDEKRMQLEQEMAHNASWNDCYTLSFHSSGSEEYGVETSNVVKAQSQIFYQEKQLVSVLPELEDVLLNLMDIMVHYSTTYCNSPDLCNALFILMGRIATNRTLHDAFLKELEDILNLELCVTFYSRLNLSTQDIWQLQAPQVCSQCHPNGVPAGTLVDITCCDLHRFLRHVPNNCGSHGLLYPHSQFNNLIKAATDYSYQNQEATIISSKVQRAAILNMARIVYVYTVRTSHGRSASLSEGDKIAYRQSFYVTQAEEDKERNSEQKQNGTHVNISVLQREPESLRVSHNIDVETEPEGDICDCVDLPKMHAKSLVRMGSSFSLRAYLLQDPPLESSVGSSDTSSLQSMSVSSAGSAGKAQKKIKEFSHIKTTDMKRYINFHQSRASDKAFVVATLSMQNDIITFVQSRLYSKANIANLVFCAEALPPFCRICTFRNRVKSLLFIFLKLITSKVLIVQQNAIRNIGYMLAGISKGCSITEIERAVITENYIIYFIFHLFCSVLEIKKLSTPVTIPLFLKESHINAQLLERYHQIKYTVQVKLPPGGRCINKETIASSPLSTKFMTSKSMLTAIIQESRMNLPNCQPPDELNMSMTSSDSHIDVVAATAVSEDLHSGKTPAGTPYLSASIDGDEKKDRVGSLSEESATLDDPGYALKENEWDQSLLIFDDVTCSSKKDEWYSKDRASALDDFIYRTENHTFHLKRLLGKATIELTPEMHKEIEISLLRTLPEVFETVACSNSYQDITIKIVIDTLTSRASHQSIIHTLISSLPGIYTNKYTTSENKKRILACLESFLTSPHCTRDTKLLFLYSFSDYAVGKKETRALLTRFVGILLQMYYSILQIPEEVQVHEGQISLDQGSPQSTGPFYLQFLPDMYITIVPKSFSTRIQLKSNDPHGFLGNPEEDRVRQCTQSLVYKELSMPQWMSPTASPVFGYSCPDAPTTKYTYVINTDWRRRCDVVDCLVKHLILYCETFSMQTGFFVFITVILHIIEDDCQSVGDCFIRLLGLEITPLLQHKTLEASKPLAILCCALFGHTYNEYGVTCSWSGISANEYSWASYARLCHHFLLPSLRHQKLWVRLLHHVSRRVQVCEWFARLFTFQLLALPLCESSVRLSFIISVLNLSRKRKMIVFSEEYYEVMRLCSFSNEQAVPYLTEYEKLYYRNISRRS